MKPAVSGDGLITEGVGAAKLDPLALRAVE